MKSNHPRMCPPNTAAAEAKPYLRQDPPTDGQAYMLWEMAPR